MANNKLIGQIKELDLYKEDTTKVDIKLDLTDKKILYLLGENGRYSTTALAKKLRLNRETVAYRINKMNENDFLHGCLTLLNHKKLDLKNFIVYIKLKTVNSEKDFIAYLHELNEVTRLKNCSGSYDIQIIFTVKNEEEFIGLLDKIVDKYHIIIEDYDFMEILEEDFLGLSLLLEKIDPKDMKIFELKGSTFEKEFKLALSNTEETKIDDKDRDILELLKLDGRITIRELSAKINLAPIAVENRIKKLVSSGVIKKFVPLASISALGYQWWKVFFKFKNVNRNKFFAYIKYHPNILWYMRFLGRWDYQFSVFAKNNSEFHKILDEIRTEFADNIISYDSIIVFNQFKYVQRVK